MEAVEEQISIKKYEAYKDSGVEWLGEIPEHWNIVRIKTIIESECNGVWGSDPDASCDTYCIRVADFDRNTLQVGTDKLTLRSIKERDLEGRSLRSGDLLIEKSGGGEKTLVGQVVLFSHAFKAVCSNFVARIRLQNQWDTRYVNYLFSALYANGITYKHIKQTTGIQNLDTYSYYDELIGAPTVKEQTAIADFLDRKTAQIDKAIALKEALIQRLKERRQILIHRAVTRGLNPDVRMKDSGVEWIGEVPEHWEVLHNRALFIERNEPGNSSLPILSVSIHTAVSNEELGDDENLRGKIRIEDKGSYKLVEPGDIAFNMMRAWQGAIGAVSTVGMVSPAYIVARPDNRILAAYFEFLYRTKSFIQQMDRYSRGITDFRKRLYWNEFKQLITIVPPKQEQEQIVEFILDYSEKNERAIASYGTEIAKLKEYKSTLINAAVTGKIKVF